MDADDADAAGDGGDRGAGGVGGGNWSGEGDDRDKTMLMLNIGFARKCLFSFLQKAKNYANILTFFVKICKVSLSRKCLFS